MTTFTPKALPRRCSEIGCIIGVFEIKGIHIVAWPGKCLFHVPFIRDLTVIG